MEREAAPGASDTIATPQGFYDDHDQPPPIKMSWRLRVKTLPKKRGRRVCDALNLILRAGEINCRDANELLRLAT
jgi:hypothetical protein